MASVIFVGPPYNHHGYLKIATIPALGMVATNFVFCRPLQNRPKGASVATLVWCFWGTHVNLQGEYPGRAVFN